MILPRRQHQLEELERRLDITFLNKLLLNQALTHSSYANEMKRREIKDNEVFEFLGDAVLKLIVSEYLINKFPLYAEGNLTKIRATVVSDAMLTQVAVKLLLGRYLLLGGNERRSGGRLRRSNLANAFEALIAAVYLDGGIGKARDFLLPLLKEDIEKVSQVDFIVDYKSTVQEMAQKKKWGLPFYGVTKEVGPKHRRTFWIEVRIKGKIYGRGSGRTKKEAEQSAAKEALATLKEEEGKELEQTK